MSMTWGEAKKIVIDVAKIIKHSGVVRNSHKETLIHHTTNAVVNSASDKFSMDSIARITVIAGGGNANTSANSAGYYCGGGGGGVACIVCNVNKGEEYQVQFSSGNTVVTIKGVTITCNKGGNGALSSGGAGGTASISDEGVFIKTQIINGGSGQSSNSGDEQTKSRTVISRGGAPTKTICGGGGSYAGGAGSVSGGSGLYMGGPGGSMGGDSIYGYGGAAIQSDYIHSGGYGRILGGPNFALGTRARSGIWGHNADFGSPVKYTGFAYALGSGGAYGVDPGFPAVIIEYGEDRLLDTYI